MSRIEEGEVSPSASAHRRNADGEEAYHSECFRCIQCNAKIDDLVFAKTSHGVYCMKCYQERKDAKRRREERERMERAEKLMEKLLPTIPVEKKASEFPMNGCHWPIIMIKRPD
ncbi:hypothetical protein BGZ76_004284 [Entomortierella beljakovae]|nr:hypothetical protein BGZ76_004284 [Entomortierella beljakovae]